MRQKLITLDPTSFEIASSMPNFSECVRNQLRKHRNKTQKTLGEFKYCRHCGYASNGSFPYCKECNTLDPMLTHKELVEQQVVEEFE
jgi:uncharacterized short protein YbdD (DUF466 family)